MVAGTVAFPGVTREAAFDYLSDPAHRAEWQSSLERVDGVDGEPRVGQRWTDVTKPGLQPSMRTTELVRPERWSESGTWRFVRADLTLVFREVVGGCEVHYDFRIHALGPLGLAASYASRPAVAADLRKAARILSNRS
jgi:hypothetical protein